MTERHPDPGPDIDNLAVAEQHSERARKQLAETLVEIQNRLNPKVLAREAAQDIREAGEEIARAGIEAAKRNPLPLAGIGAAIGLFAARKPLRDLFRSTKTAPDGADLPPAPSRKGPRR